MLTVLLVIQIIIAVAMIIIILLQHTSSDGLGGLGGGGSSGHGVLSGRASATILTKTTALLAAAFMANSLFMASIASNRHSEADSALQKLEGKTQQEQMIETEKAPIQPSVPLAE